MGRHLVEHLLALQVLGDADRFQRRGGTEAGDVDVQLRSEDEVRRVRRRPLGCDRLRQNDPGGEGRDDPETSAALTSVRVAADAAMLLGLM
jgi:hypothetical protein